MKIFVTGGTGYMGSRLIPELLRRGHDVTALARAGSESRLPDKVKRVVADALAHGAYTGEVRGSEGFVHLIGVHHPGPAKAAQFQSIDRVSVEVAARSARDGGVGHFVYLSVAQPAPTMHAYIEVRAAGESLISMLGLSATFLRPWYVLGPGHWWPCALIPFYWICERLPSTREGALRLGLVTIRQMVNALVWAVENPSVGERILEVPQIRALAKGDPVVRGAETGGAVW